MSNKTGNKCRKCGADMVLNPKTGKEFCEKKCWLESGGKTEQNLNRFQEINKQEKIEGMYNEKKDNIKWLNALNNATLLMAHGIVKPVGNSIFDTILGMAHKYYTAEAPKEIKKKEDLPIIEAEDWKEIDSSEFPF